MSIRTNIIPILLGGAILVSTRSEISSMQEKLNEYKNNLDISLEDLRADFLILKEKISLLDVVIGQNLDQFIQNLRDLDMVLDDLEILTVLSQLQQAKLEAMKAIELAESAYNFFNGPIDLANYISVNNGIVTYKRDYVQVANDTYAVNPGDINSTSSVIGVTGTRLGSTSFVVNKFGYNPSVISMLPKVINFNKNGFILFRPNQSNQDKKYIITFSNGQAVQGVNSNLALYCKSDFYSHSSINIPAASRITETNGDSSRTYNLVSDANFNSNTLDNSSGLDFQITILTPSILEVTAFAQGPRSINKTVDVWYRWEIALHQNPTKKKKSFKVENLFNALQIRLSMCQVTGVYEYIKGTPGSSSGEGSIIL